MSTENIDTGTPAEGQVENTQREYSAIEQRAMEQGWRPKDEFNGEPEAFIDAPEFIRRGELFSKIEHQSKELKQVRAALDALKDHNSKIKEAEYKRAMRDLEAARKQALVDGEHDRFFALEEKIEEVKQEKQEFDEQLNTVKVEAPEVHPEFQSWVEKNQWYTQDEAMAAYADRVGTKLAREGVRPAEVLQRVEAEVKKRFPDNFVNKKQSRPMAVEPAGRSGGSRDSFQLDDTEREIMRKFVRTGVMTEKEYIEQLKITKGVK